MATLAEEFSLADCRVGCDCLLRCSGWPVETEIKSSYEASPFPLFKTTSTSELPGNVVQRCLDTGGGSMDAKGFGCIDFLTPRMAAGLDGDVVAGDIGEGLEVGSSLDELSSSSSLL